VSPLKPGPRVRGGVVLIFEVDVPHLPRSQQGVDVATESRVAWCRCQAARSSSLNAGKVRVRTVTLRASERDEVGSRGDWALSAVIR
jgi:hypothetical protein